jgi:dolichyl-phosphate-mannose--protein O-mannosyl transferase
MTTYLLGNLTGRFALSYALVWIVLFAAMSKFSWREAFRRTHHWSGLTAVVTLFLLAIIASQPSGGQL